ncbi:unnamed protein product [Rhizoctonia solani]|nr:unnamed protein product [Rhizoctonia solani]
MEVDYDSTLGAIYIGVTVTACLYGISTLHGYTYWNQQKQDSTITRTSMAVLWLADSAKLVCATHIGYRLLITGYEDDPAALFYSTCDFILYSFALHLHHEDGATVDLFDRFCDASLTFGTTLSSLAWIHRDIREMEKYQWVASLWLGTATFGSIIITYMLSALLASTYVQAQSILTVANLLAFSFMGQYIRIAANIPLGTLNLITLLVIMNSRPQEISDGAIVEEHERSMTGHKDRSLKDRSQTSLESCSQISQLSLKTPSKTHTTGQSIKVFVQKETHVISIPRTGVDYSHHMIHYPDALDVPNQPKARVDLAQASLA